ncbi:CARDB domain-containing protein [Hymenobacter guriensis]|uniref:T9SS type A sorting domain-containing protein n=1 Tax=Hymenobacter guriensis TaxID=2793065 RepID=A0ABS0L4N4_9BACT|nr:CARDB domain-containing protein [Hymenobacter guriensis]MBG8555034.1 T9SS type A sorting domain-containing protein [Hymenobacter guriensis]
MMHLYPFPGRLRRAAFCLLPLAALLSYSAAAQTYTVPVSGNTVISACEGTLYDNGGTGNTKPDADGSITINPAQADNKVTLIFSKVTSNFVDNLIIYDGPSTSAPVLAEFTFTTSSNPGTISATNASGALTVRHVTGFSGSAGFSASISCAAPAPKPDLQVQGASASPLSVIVGGEVVVSSSIHNAAGLAATSSTLGYYLSTDPIRDASDVLLGNSAGGELAVGSSDAREATVTIPASTPPGSYYLLFAADYLDAVSESNEQNNVASVALTVKAALPDLQFVTGTATVSASSVTAGGTLASSVTLRNNGPASASASTISYYLSPDATFDAADLLLQTDTGGALAAATEASRAAALSIPVTTAAGSYYVLFVTDAPGTVLEEDETNNLASVALNVNAAQPDLEFTAATLGSATAVAGTSVTVSATLRNSGPVSAPASTIGYYLSTDATFDGNDVALQTVAGETLASGATDTRSATLTIPVGTVVGSYFILFVADPATAVEESDEANNLASVALEVTEPLLPDLAFVASGTTLSAASATAGSSVLVTSAITNAGNGPATSIPFAVYLSTDQSLDAADILVGSSAGNTLPSGQTSQQQLSVTIPTEAAAGSYYLLVVLNRDNALTESNVANNLTSLAFQVDVATAGKEQTAGLSVGVYPNPSRTGYFLVELMSAKASTGTATLTLFNSIGQRVEQQVVTSRTGITKFDTRNLSRGVYLLHLTGKGLYVVKQVAIE